ncbi:MAG: hypothetical protein F4Y86_15355 [Gammaproteobacteria bacterium]|nr:hypothetical protein [Gammaproteobacteria bacterium]
MLRRHVVERCIYAVDGDPLAIELCRLSLWIETMDRLLPFGFLDHKVKCGNSLIGGWFDEFNHYPVMAWKNREGGDKTHSNGVHFEKNARTKAIKAFVKETLTPDLRLVLQGQDLFQADSLALASGTHAEAIAVIKRMQALAVHEVEERANLYRDELLASGAWGRLKDAMDLWAACWFWPADELDVAPLPQTFLSPSTRTRNVAKRIASEMRFFHWELEFPDVFGRVDGGALAGFDAVIGNPPWDIAKPVSKEFFSNIDPLYRSYGKQEALRRQKSYFADNAVIEHDWLNYNGRFRAQSNYMSHAANPFGDPTKTDKSQARFSVARGAQTTTCTNAGGSNARKARDSPTKRIPTCTKALPTSTSTSSFWRRRTRCSVRKAGLASSCLRVFTLITARVRCVPCSWNSAGGSGCSAWRTVTRSSRSTAA